MLYAFIFVNFEVPAKLLLLSKWAFQAARLGAYGIENIKKYHNTVIRLNHNIFVNINKSAVDVHHMGMQGFKGKGVYL